MPFRSTAIAKERDQNLDIVGKVVLTHDERHLRRKLLHLQNDDVVMLDLKEPVVLSDGDLLILEGNAGYVEIVAAREELYEILPRDEVHQIELAWHLGNRHLAAQFQPGRILIERDHVIKSMLEGLGAKVSEIVETFSPLHGAYHSHGGHGHDHHHHAH